MVATVPAGMVTEALPGTPVAAGVAAVVAIRVAPVAETVAGAVAETTEAGGAATMIILRTAATMPDPSVRVSEVLRVTNWDDVRYPGAEATRRYVTGGVAEGT